MADIESVRLPDNSTFNIKDPTALHGTDGINALADVSASSPSDSDLLIYKGSTSEWTAQANPFSNENLLINPFFTVNQRGNTSGALNNALVGNYISDKWFVDRTSGAIDGTYSISSGIVTIANTNGTADFYHSQVLDNDVVDGKTATASVKLADNSIVSATIHPNDASTTAYIYSGSELIGQFNYIRTSHRFNVIVKACKTLAYKSAKLEPGSVSTLANDIEPNYTSELLKCQRSFIRFGARSSSSFLAVLTATSSTTALGVLPLPVDMSGTMTLTRAGTFTLVDSGTDINVTGITIRNACTNLQGLQVTVSGGLTAGHAVLMYADSGAYIDITT